MLFKNGGTLFQLPGRKQLIQLAVHGDKTLRIVMPAINEQTLEVAERDFRKLSMETAQRTVRFWQLHNRIEK